MKPIYDMVCTNAFAWYLDIKRGDKCRILDFKIHDYDHDDMLIALEFERNICSHDAFYAFPDSGGKWGHCAYVIQEDMKHFKFIEEE